MKLLASTAAKLALAFAVAGFAAGCGGSGGEGQQTPAAANFADCLRQQGIALPTARPDAFPTARPSGFPAGVRPSGFPGGGRATARPTDGTGQAQGGFGNFQRPEGVDEQTWQKALQACSSLRPSGVPGRGGFGASRRPGNGPGGVPAAYLNCLSEHGVTYSPGQTLPEDAKVCEALRPSGTGTP